MENQVVMQSDNQNIILFQYKFLNETYEDDTKGYYLRVERAPIYNSDLRMAFLEFAIFCNSSDCLEAIKFHFDNIEENKDVLFAETVVKKWLKDYSLSEVNSLVEDCYYKDEGGDLNGMAYDLSEYWVKKVKLLKSAIKAYHNYRFHNEKLSTNSNNGVAGYLNYYPKFNSSIEEILMCLRSYVKNPEDLKLAFLSKNKPKIRVKIKRQEQQKFFCIVSLFCRLGLVKDEHKVFNEKIKCFVISASNEAINLDTLEKCSSWMNFLDSGKSSGSSRVDRDVLIISKRITKNHHSNFDD
ncbi:hypothetical protein [Reichenbachiella sp.]|uniref:hypothetical protein n=1 Tax=Reichenbachiella sp. TaxID=2184521 RepID=UPI003B5A54B8